MLGARAPRLTGCLSRRQILGPLPLSETLSTETKATLGHWPNHLRKPEHGSQEHLSWRQTVSWGPSPGPRQLISSSSPRPSPSW